MRTTAGRPLLIEAEPQRDGNLVLILGDLGWTAEGRRGYRAAALRQGGMELYAIHRCPV